MIQTVLSDLFYYSGAFFLLRFLDRKKTKTIFYHGVSSKKGMPLERFEGKHVPLNEFEEQMRFVKKHFNVVPLTTIVKCIKSKKSLPQNSIAITFDDGYKNNYTDAFPVLKKLGLPAAVFLACNFIESKELLWFDSLTKTIGQTLVKKIFVKELQQTFELETLKDKKLAVIKLKGFLRKLPLEERKKVLPCILEELGQKAQQPSQGVDCFAMNWQQVKEMSRHGIEFFPHSMNHELLPFLKDEKAEKEIIDSKKALKEKLGGSFDDSIFSYPNGAFNKKTIALLKHNGFEAAFTVEHGANSLEQDLFELRRIPVNSNYCKVFALNLFFDVGKIHSKIILLYSKIFS